MSAISLPSVAIGIFERSSSLIASDSITVVCHFVSGPLMPSTT